MEEASRSLFVSSNGHDVVDSEGGVVTFGDDGVTRIKALVFTVGNGLTIKRSSIKQAGKGLYTSERIKKNQLITYYSGAVSARIPVASLEPSFRSHARRINGHYVIYGNYTEEGIPIDLTQNTAQVDGKGGAAFINAMKSEPSRNNCDWFVFRASGANTLLFEDEDPFRIVILIYALRDIEVGEELFIDYGEEYWKKKTDSGRVVPTFITREAYYKALQEARHAREKRKVTRIQPTLLENQPVKKPRVGGLCHVCSSYTSMVDVEEKKFLCSVACVATLGLL